MSPGLSEGLCQSRFELSSGSDLCAAEVVTSYGLLAYGDSEIPTYLHQLVALQSSWIWLLADGRHGKTGATADKLPRALLPSSHGGCVILNDELTQVTTPYVSNILIDQPSFHMCCICQVMVLNVR